MHFTANTLRKWRKSLLATDTTYILPAKTGLASPIAKVVVWQTAKDTLH